MCNQHCIYCYARDGMKWDTISNIDNIKRELSLLRDFPKSIISLIGGEPTLHPKFIEILKYVKGFHHELHVYTNGTTKFFNEIDIELLKNFTWTFSYHGIETDDNIFFKNIRNLIERDINVELTIPAQNMNENILEFSKELNIDTVITFIHDTKNKDYNYNIEDWVFNVAEPNINNMSKYSKELISYTNKTCYYNEIDIVNSIMTSNSCNHNINLRISKENLDIIKKYKLTVCKEKYCKQDCAFLLPRKE